MKLPTIRQYLTPYNHNNGRGGHSILYIVIHYTSGRQTAAGAALANCKYSAGGNRGASAHYFIDDGDTIYQSVLDENTAWAVGSRSGYKCGCRNNNSISIEVCTAGAFTAKEIETLSWLVKRLQKQYNVPDSRVIRHYDVTGKACPAYYVDASRWAALKAQILGGATVSTSSSQIAVKTEIKGSQVPHGGSIAKYLELTGRDASFSHRSELAKQYGIANYRGTAEQNTKLLEEIINADNQPLKPGWTQKDGKSYLIQDDGKPYRGVRIVDAGDHKALQFFSLEDGHLLKGPLQVFADSYGTIHFTEVN